MFTANYTKFQRARFTAGGSYNKIASLVDVKGIAISAQACMLWCADIGYWMGKGKCADLETDNMLTLLYGSSLPGVYFGAGTTPATKEDYKLEKLITTGLSITSGTSVAWTDDGNGKHTAAADFIIRNTSSEEISISEIGIFTPVGTETDKKPDDYVKPYYVLMERTVLTEPITIAPGEPKVVTYKITFNQSAV